MAKVQAGACKMPADTEDCKRLIEEVNHRQVTLKRGGAGLPLDIKYVAFNEIFKVELTREDARTPPGRPNMIDADEVCKYTDMCGDIEYGKGPENIPDGFKLADYQKLCEK